MMSDVTPNISIQLVGQDPSQIKMLVDMFKKEKNVLAEPAYTLVIVLYTILVTTAGVFIIATYTSMKSLEISFH